MNLNSHKLIKCSLTWQQSSCKLLRDFTQLLHAVAEVWAGQVGVTWQGCRCTRSIDRQRLDRAACWRTQCVHLQEYLDLCWTRPGPLCCHGNSERHLELVREEEHYVLIKLNKLSKLKKNLFLLVINNIRVIFLNDLRWNYWHLVCQQQSFNVT